MRATACAWKRRHQLRRMTVCVCCVHVCPCMSNFCACALLVFLSSFRKILGLMASRQSSISRQARRGRPGHCPSGLIIAGLPSLCRSPCLGDVVRVPPLFISFSVSCLPLCAPSRSPRGRQAFCGKRNLALQSAPDIWSRRNFERASWASQLSYRDMS